MTNYKNIFGKPVKFLATDPDNEQAEGQIWYNSTADAFKNVLVNEAWSSASNQTQAQRDGGYGQSTPSTASWFAGGVDSSRNSTTTQEWNGSGWSNGGNINTGREEITGFGLVSAATLAGGATYPPSALKNEVEEYDGSSWTAATALPAKRKQAAGAGTQTAGLVSFGAVDPPSAAGSINATALEYDGSSWTSGGTGNTARSQISGCGTQTAALAFGGHTSPSTAFPAATEEYDGTSWTSGGTMNIARGLMAGNGIQTSALAYAGFTPYSAKTEAYDGTAWTNKPDLATARDRAHGGGSDSSNGLCAGGLTSPGVVSVVEEFNRSVNVITAAAWASGPAINNARLTKNNGLGPTSASLIFGGNPGTAPYASNSTEEYDGSSWTNGGAYPSSASEISGAAGTQTAALGFAQSASPTTNVTNYDGTSWSTIPATFPAGSAGVGTGEQSAAIYSQQSGTNSLEWDNTSWTAGGTMNTSRTGHGAGFGNTTSAMSATGQTSPTTNTADSEEYDGTTWTSVGNVITARKRLNASKPLSNASGYIFGGTPPTNNAGPTFTNTELWNGTNWSTAPNLGTGTGNQFGAGTTDAFSIGGQPNPPITSATEIFNPETTALNIKTLTTS